MITPRSYQKIAYGILLSFTLVTILILLFIIWFVLKNGIPVVNLKFLLAHPEEMGKAGGIFPVIIGTILLTLSAIIVAAPLGIGTAIYLTEYTKEGFWTKVIRFGGDCLAGVPSIIFGLFGYVLF
ncbi:MAG: phosphate ABC transporter, permease protein PstA, partial [Candidatus Omnitrophica bacterium]|nr:phosphate ABC transporter, permease protein PstA [Candidatus Omnitrophota bacterium]